MIKKCRLVFVAIAAVVSLFIFEDVRWHFAWKRQVTAKLTRLLHDITLKDDTQNHGELRILVLNYHAAASDYDYRRSKTERRDFTNSIKLNSHVLNSREQLAWIINNYKNASIFQSECEFSMRSEIINMLHDL